MKIQKKGYSVIVSILMVGFLLIISTGVFHLVLGELNDNRGRENYLRASAGAEGAMELALLNLKEKGYGYYDRVEKGINNKSVILSQNPTDMSQFKPNEVKISYDMDSKVDSYTGRLSPLGFDILPLFYLDDSDSPEKRVTALNFDDTLGDISWNIVSTNGGISGKGSFFTSTNKEVKEIVGGKFVLMSTTVGAFLSDASIRENNYLILFNTNKDNSMEYTLESVNTDEYFTKPRTEIISSAQVGKYKQNFHTIVDNTQYLNVLKYSIFSN